MSWNIEGLARNIHSLKHFANIHLPDLIFISEPQIYQNDIDLIMLHLRGEYNFSLNSDDKFDLDLPLVKSKANGGTMILWKLCHDPFITIHPVSTSSILPIIFNPPGSPISIHVSVYLPTHGQDSKFVEDLSTLVVCLDELLELFPEAPIFLRGDFNVNVRNIKRTDLLSHFCNDLDLTEAPIQHKTYHHFTGNGISDSNLDKLIFSKTLKHPESVERIYCKLEEPAIESHHDMIVSVFHLPAAPVSEASPDNIVAPKVENLRTKVIWSDDGIEKYQNIVVPELQRIQDLWFSPASSSRTSLSLLCESTNNVLSTSAIHTNRTVRLNQKFTPKSKPTPLHIRQSANKLLKKHNSLKLALQRASPDSRQLRADYLCSRSAHRKLVRENKAIEAIARDSSSSQVLTRDPSPLFRRIKSSKRGKAMKINKLHVENRLTLMNLCLMVFSTPSPN